MKMGRTKIGMLAQALPTLTRSASNVGEAEQIRLVTGTNRKSHKMAEL